MGNEDLIVEGVKDGVKEVLKWSIDMAEHFHGDNWIYNAVQTGVKAAILEAIDEGKIKIR